MRGKWEESEPGVRDEGEKTEQGKPVRQGLHRDHEMSKSVVCAGLPSTTVFVTPDPLLSPETGLGASTGPFLPEWPSELPLDLSGPQGKCHTLL